MLPAFNPADFDLVKKLALELPGTAEGLSHEGTPAVKVGKTLLCRLHESGELISAHIGFEPRDRFLDAYPDLFFLPAHIARWPYMALRLPATRRVVLREALEAAWRGLAGKRRWLRTPRPGGQTEA